MIDIMMLTILLKMWFNNIKDKKKNSLSAKVLFMNHFPWARESEIFLCEKWKWIENGVVKKSQAGSIQHNKDNMYKKTSEVSLLCS